MLLNKLGTIEETEFLKPLGPTFSIREKSKSSNKFTCWRYVVCECKACSSIACYRLSIYKINKSCGCCSQANKPVNIYGDHEELMVEKCKEGWSVGKIARLVGCSNWTVQNKLDKYGLRIKKDQSGKKNSAWRGYKDLSLTYWNQIKNGASSRDLEFDLSIEEIWDMYERQNRKCAISGIDILISPTKKKKKDKQTASLDRIDSSKGYTSDNIQWVHQKVNRMKTNMSDQELIQWCKLISAKSIYG